MDSNITKFLMLLFLIISFDCFAIGTSDRVIESKGNIHLLPSVKSYTAKPIHIEEQNAIRLEDFIGGQYIGLKAPSSVASSLEFTLPGLDGTSGQCLKTDGSLVLSFGDCSEFVASNDNRLLRSNTGGGADIQESGITVSDLDEITGVAALTTASATVNGYFAVVSTATPSIPAPVATQAEIDLMTPQEGSQSYNSTTKKLNVYDGTDWTEVGGGGGASFENILIDGGFDQDASSGTNGLTCGIGNTCAQITTASDYINGTGALEITMGGSNLVDVTHCYDNSAGAWDNKEAFVKAEIKSTITDLEFCYYNGTSDESCVATDENKPNYFEYGRLGFVDSGENPCWHLKSTANPTAGAKIYVDTGYAGVASIRQAIPVENNFWAKVSSTGVVSSENQDWINGNCVNSPTGVYTCTFVTNFFTVAPNCRATGADYGEILIPSLSSSSAVINVKNSGGTDSDGNFSIVCSKSGADYRESSENVLTHMDNVPLVKYSNAGNTITTGNTEILNFVTKKFDTNGLVTTGAGWNYLAPKTTKYRINSKCVSTNIAASAIGNNAKLKVFVDGSQAGVLDEVYSSTTTSMQYNLGGHTDIEVNYGQTIDVRLENELGASWTVINTDDRCFVEISDTQKDATGAFPKDPVCNLVVSGDNSFSQSFGYIQPRQDREGNWSAWINFGGTNSNTSSINFTFTGITFRSGADQSLGAVGGGPIVAGCVLNGGASTGSCVSSGTVAYRANGEVLLASKPTISGCTF